MSESERTKDLCDWARSRIETCRRQEEKFTHAWASSMRAKHQLGPPQALVEAWTERMTLQAVLARLEATP